jgi:hypothetical protein
MEDQNKPYPLDTVRLFRVSSILFQFPKERRPPPRIQFLNPVEVQADGRRLGWASVWVADSSLLANLVFSYQSPERLSIESGSEKLYARLKGVFEMDEEPFEYGGLYDADRLPRVTEVYVTSIEITREPAFRGQPPLGEIIL